MNQKMWTREEREEMNYFVDALRNALGLAPLHDLSAENDRTLKQRYAARRWSVTSGMGQSVRYEVL